MNQVKIRQKIGPVERAGMYIQLLQRPRIDNRRGIDAEGPDPPSLNINMATFVTHLLCQPHFGRLIRRQCEPLGAGLHNEGINLGVKQQQAPHGLRIKHMIVRAIAHNTASLVRIIQYGDSEPCATGRKPEICLQI